MSALDSKRFRALKQDWTARFGFNASCAIEEETGRGFFDIVGPMLMQLDDSDRSDTAKVMAAVRALRMSDLRLVFHHALLEAQPDTTREEAGDIIADLGMTAAMEVVAWAVMRALPGQDTGGETGDVENPPKAKPAAKRRKTGG